MEGYVAAVRNAVVDDRLGLMSAIRQEVPEELRTMVKNEIEMDIRRGALFIPQHPHDQALSDCEETIVEVWLATLASFGTPKTCKELVEGVRMGFGKTLSDSWARKFIKRHKVHIQLRLPKKTKAKRMRGRSLRSVWQTAE